MILFTAPTLGQILDADESKTIDLPAEALHSGLYRAIAQVLHGVQDQSTLQFAVGWAAERRDWPVGAVYDELLASVSPLVGVEKSPETSMSAGPLTRLRSLYPRARFLHLTRHPVTSQRSMHEHWNGRRWWPRGMDVPGPTWCAQSWRDTHRRIMAFAASLPPEQTMRVRSEDLLNGTDALRSVANWLRLSTDDASIDAMRHPEISPFANKGHGSFRGGLDPKFLASPTLRATDLPAEFEFPDDWAVDPWVQADCAILATELGY